MKFKFHPEAELEFDEAVRYYEECQAGLGLEFAEEVYGTISRIAAYPDAWSMLSKSTRRCLVNRFPYGVLYQVKSGMLRIVACIDVPDIGEKGHELPNKDHDGIIVVGESGNQDRPNAMPAMTFLSLRKMRVVKSQNQIIPFWTSCEKILL